MPQCYGQVMSQQSLNDFFIWGIDDSPYGPVELPVLVKWIKDERVLADTWIFVRSTGEWHQAAELPELKMFFSGRTGAVLNAPPADGITPGALRRIKILAGLNDAQLAHLADYLETQHVRQWSAVVTQGEPGDGMYLVLDGELRARTMVGGRETILAPFAAGDFFGDISLFDRGPRSADVIANTDSTLLKISTTAFDRLTREAPALATPSLQATARTLAARIRADNKRLGQMTEQFGARGM
jgi:CRP/FNR family cyclic AMP-dependent transcriptional regulator